MKKYQIILLVVIVILIVGLFFWFKKYQVKDDLFVPTNTNEQNLTELKIERNKVGPFNVRRPIPGQEMIEKYGYKVEEKPGEGIIEGAEGDPRGSAFVISRDEKELFIIYPAFDKIWEFKITSSEFKTSEGVGIGATISDFIKTYPDYRVWYTYVGDWFVIDTPQYQGVQFQLDKNGFINKTKDINKYDFTTLSLSDFKIDTKITAVRIYYVP